MCLTPKRVERSASHGGGTLCGKVIAKKNYLYFSIIPDAGTYRYSSTIPIARTYLLFQDYSLLLELPISPALFLLLESTYYSRIILLLEPTYYSHYTAHYTASILCQCLDKLKMSVELDYLGHLKMSKNVPVN